MRQTVQDIICKSKLKKFILEMILKRKKWILYYEKKKVQYMSLDEILKYQTEKLRNLLRIASKSPYYRDVINSTGVPIQEFTLKDLKKLPILTKDIIRTQKDKLLTKPKEELFPNSSGGSTGEPINFYQDKNYIENTWATMMIILEMCGWYYGARIARLWGAPQDKKKLESLKGKLSLYLQNTRFYDTFDMSEEKMYKYHKDMTQFQPEVIISYASSIYLLAKFLESRSIYPNYPTISIGSSAETLYPYMRETIEKVFGVKVYDIYGSREVSAIACECEAHNGLHIFMDNVIIECLDLKTGEDTFDKPGEIIVTDLNNYGMPFIRYKIGDMGVLTQERCPCGRNTLLFKRIVGRTTDNFVTKTGKIIHGEYFTHLFYGIEGIKEFQLVQESFDLFNLYIVKTDEFSSNICSKIENEIKKVAGQDITLNIYFVKSVPKTPTGKYKFTISKINLESIWTKTDE